MDIVQFISVVLAVPIVFLVIVYAGEFFSKIFKWLWPFGKINKYL